MNSEILGELQEAIIQAAFERLADELNAQLGLPAAAAPAVTSGVAAAGGSREVAP